MDPTHTQKRAIEQVEALVRKDADFHEHVKKYMAGQTAKKEALCERFNVILNKVVREAGLNSVKDRNALKRYLRTHFNNLANGGMPETVQVVVAQSPAYQEATVSHPEPRPAPQRRPVRW